MSTDMERAPAPLIADPAPLGLAAFALTTFLLSGHNATFIPDAVWVGAALFYGGLIQLLAGMWEFRRNNVFGATAFATYGGFWLALGSYVVFLTMSKGFAAQLVATNDLPNTEAWFVVAFLIFNSYMLLWSMRVNVGVFLVFLTLEITEILLAIGFFRIAHGHSAYWLHAGGWMGVITAIVAWYTSAALVGIGMAGRPILPVGPALWRTRDTRPATSSSESPIAAH
jgi:hypothetical protein